MDLGGKVFSPSNNQLQFGVESRFLRELLPLLLQAGHALTGSVLKVEIARD